MDLDVAPAGLEAASAALGAASLPSDDISEPGLQLLAFRENGEVVAFGGFESLGQDALLRSIVVLPAHRGRGIGREVIRRLLGAARRDGASAAYLLTTDASAYFGALGFDRVEREQAPASIRSTRQMAALCPASATLMCHRLDR